MSEGPTLNTKLRIDRALELLQQIPYRRVIAQMMAEEGVCRRHATRWVSAARNIILAETKQDKEYHVCDSYNTYKSIIDSPNSTNIERLKAQELLDRLLGLQAPWRRPHEPGWRSALATPNR